jgi:hypothetical protein
MSHRTFVVPNLAVVTVAGDVSPLVASGIEFQLGHFESSPPTIPSELPRIIVEPYARFAGGPGDVSFHAQRVVPGRLLHHPAERHAVERMAAGFAVFTDSPAVLIVLLLQSIALERGRTFLHAAGWCDDQGAATLLPGPGGVGKTALLAAAVLRHGARLLGDDLVLVGAAGAEAFPRAFVLKDYHRSLFPAAFAEVATQRRSRDRWRPLVKFVRENAPFHGLLKSVFRRAGRLESTSAWLHDHATAPDFHPVPVARLFGADRVATAGPIRRVVYVERHMGTEFVHAPLPADEVVRRSVAVLHHEWADWLRWFSALGAAGLVDWAAHLRETDAAMRAAFAGASVHLLQVPARATPEELERVFAERVGFAAGRP